MLYFKDNNGSISPQLSYWESWKLCLGLFSLSLSLSLYIYIYITWEIFMYLLVNIVNHHHLIDDGLQDFAVNILKKYFRETHVSSSFN